MFPKQNSRKPMRVHETAEFIFIAVGKSSVFATLQIDQNCDHRQIEMNLQRGIF